MAQNGGARPGAGRPKGGANRINDEARSKALATGESPLEFLLKAMRDETADFSTRMDAAKAAAPYLHAKLSSVDMTATIEKDASQLTDAELLAIAAASRADSSEAESYTEVAH